MPLAPGTRPSLRDSIAVPPDVVFRELDGEAVVLNLDSGICFWLDEVGTRIWQLIGEHGLLQTVFDTMCREYDVAPDTPERDLLSLVDGLCTKGLGRVSPR